MDVREQGLTLLWLRVMWMANTEQRLKLDRYFTKWIQQVKFSERALEKAKEDPPEKRIACK